MKVLVTGGAGFIGSHLAEALALTGHTVTCLDNFDPYYARAIKQANTSKFAELGINLHELDLANDVSTLSELVDDVDAVFHLAAQSGIASHVPFEHYTRNNIVATHRLLEALVPHKSRVHLFYISTSSVYGVMARGDETTPPAPTSYYGVTKLASEQLALAYHRDRGLAVTVARPFSVYGERERPEKLYPKLIKSILEGTSFPLYEGSLEHVRSYTYVGDIVVGLLLMLEVRGKIVGEIFNLGTDVTATTGEGVAIIEELLGQKAKFDMKTARSGDQKETAANIEKARKILGYIPATSLRQGLEKEVVWFKEHHI